ncbi:hypothetical protein QE152_g29940 [Popillia japonica]|uniref:Uncharacterized protein n=1 Tax=Popillia japonica TaxID=7064 RepID=A0AAW1JFF2_POPJA
MEQDNVSEEGEIFDADTDNYTPLERPKNYASLQPNLKFPASRDTESESSKQSTSDSEQINILFGVLIFKRMYLPIH